TLSTIEKVLKEKNHSDHRTILESIEFINGNDYQKISSSKVIPSVKPETTMEDSKILPQLISDDNLKNLGQWQKLFQSAGRIVTGSDFPFQQISPLIQMYYLTMRQFPIDTSVKTPDASDTQRLSIMDALKSYTTYAAYSGFEEKIRGTLEKGKRADFVVLSDDMLNLNPAQLINVKILMTVIAGNQYKN
ncbi:MAG TPA: amidohydrolase family protein, partial [Ignavibacteria bacterium]|nr:amidohydrolase family protein [Ignavibacteria bacterium]